MLKTCCSATITDECVTTANTCLNVAAPPISSEKITTKMPASMAMTIGRKIRLRDRPGDGGSVQTLFHLVVHLVGDGEAERFHRPDLLIEHGLLSDLRGQEQALRDAGDDEDHGQHRQRSRFRGDRGIGRSRRQQRRR